MKDKVRDLLVEIGTEELPSSELERLGRQFAANLASALTEAGLAHEHVRGFATPRRLAVIVSGLATAQPDETVEHRGPPVHAAFDEAGQPTRAAEGFAKRHGVAVANLERRETDKAEYLFHVAQRTGATTREVLPGLVDAVLRDLPARKRMRWGVPGVSFPRPVHWLVLLFGNEVIEAEIFGVRSDRLTRGHRFHHPATIELDTPDEYEARLHDPGYVIADFAQRRARIQEQVVNAGRAAGGAAEHDEALLTEVAALVEWPVPVTGHFDTRFLDVPAEALVAVMKDHQKYFPVRDSEGRLLPVFITISNIDSEQPERVREGNERVIEPRLADAEFFWQQDRKLDPNALNAGLAAMTFHPKLGSTLDRVERMRAIAAALAQAGDSSALDSAVRLAKFDLLTQMVGEFPELQGIMGGYYARAAGHSETVAAAIREHYRPAFAGDDIPTTTEGRLLALADRLDLLVGLFAIGQPPTGDKDPYALRRAALGVLRILIEGRLDLDLHAALQQVATVFSESGIDAAGAVEPVFDFMMDRLRVYYADRGFAHDTLAAVLARRPHRPLDIDARVRAVGEFRTRTESAALSAANKRISNILRKAEVSTTGPNGAILTEAAEIALFRRYEEVAAAVAPLLSEWAYDEALATLAALHEPLARFFDEVMVMTDDESLRTHRIALLAAVRELFLQVADLSQLQSG